MHDTHATTSAPMKRWRNTHVFHVRTYSASSHKLSKRIYFWTFQKGSFRKDIFNSIYDIYFPKVFVRLKTKHILSLCITKGIAKSSKRKQKLYKKFLKHRTRKTEFAYILYKNLFESLKKKAKKKYYSEKISEYKHDAKKTWSIMKELVGKIKLKSSNFPRRITVNKVDIFDERKIAN